MRVTEDDLLEEIKKLRETMEWAASALDAIKYDLEASVYTVEDDEFATIFTVRDRLQLTLKELF